MKSTLIDIQRPVTVCKASAGTGKTYTLAAYFIGLLLSGEDFRSILAITFTNKATAEMSERILTYLYALSQGQEKDFLGRVRQFMLRDNDAPDELLEQRAGECFRCMLADFDNVHVMTIDSFLQSLLSGLAGILHTSAGTNTELDIKHVIKQAVDQLVTTDLTEENLRIIERYSLYKLSQDTSWDIRNSLSKLAEVFYDESAQILDSSDQIIFDAAFIAERREALLKQWTEHPDVVRINQLLAQLERMDLSMTNGSKIKQAMDNIKYSLTNLKKIRSKEDYFRGLTDPNMDDLIHQKWKLVPQDAQDMILEATRLIRSLKGFYFTIQLSIAESHNMELMASLQHIIMRNLSEANSALLARTASVLSDALQSGDADFILEKAGIRYRHVLMDEFQDTSRLQWNVIEKLLFDVLASEGHTLLIVGDIKQSIYRWRNGDWHIMDDLTDPDNPLTKHRLNEHFTSLTKNFRSSEQVVNFNLSLFDSIVKNYAKELADTDETEQQLIQRIYGEDFEPEHLNRFYQADKKPGGFVCFRTYEGDKVEDRMSAQTEEMFRTMEDLLGKGVQPSDMLILVRSGKSAIPFITRAHAILDTAQYPLLSKTPIVSESSFLLRASDAVNAVIAALRIVQNKDDVAVQQIMTFTEKPDIIEQIHRRVTTDTPLYEAVSELISILLTDENGQYDGEETAYINSLLDNTRAYVSAYGSHMDDFLEYWEDTLQNKSIPASSVGAIRIMTIHKSKGLQAQTVFIPYCNWKIESPEDRLWCPIAPELNAGDDQIPVSTGEDMKISAYSEAYEAELKNARVDSLNMLYVAVTRAEDNLFIYSVQPAEGHVGKFIIDALKADEYETGALVIKKPKTKDNKDELKPFSFTDTPKIANAELWANSDRVRFVQSQEGALYTEYGDEAYRRVARMEEGTLCHEIFAGIRTIDDMEGELDRAESQGLIKDTAQREHLKALISSAWEGSPEMRDWFTSPWELHLEEPIYINQKEVRPDRVMINPITNEAIVLDYKFGQWEDEYITQVKRYMKALRELGKSPVRGYLWFAQQNKLMEVK
ncbi:MAG: UvrD-helicase domain-containing protein [Paludibacteraceae bacterium]|nr:UvrD-helicase domain-containing protein [Paludibacteraceae bacterium]